MFSPSQLKTEFLPLLSVIFVSENSLVAAVRTQQTHCDIFQLTDIHLSKECYFKSIVCVFRATTVAPCCSVATMVERWHLCQSSTSPSRASRGTSLPWSVSGTWTSEPPPRTATLPWTRSTRTASRESHCKRHYPCALYFVSREGFSAITKKKKGMNLLCGHFGSCSERCL